MDYGSSNSRGSFKVEHGSDAAVVTNVHQSGAREVGAVVIEGEMWIESDTKIAEW